MLKFAIILLVVATVWGEESSEMKVDGEVGYCHYGDLKIKPGEYVPAPIGECNKIKCQDPEHNSISALTCPMWRLAPGSKCHKSERDLTKPYPDCCPKKVCPEE